MRRSQISMFVGLLSVLAVFHPGPTQAEEKLVIMVGAATGGGHDGLARMLGRHFEARTPGLLPEVVNVAGEGGKIAAKLISEGPADGTLIGILPSGVLLDQFLDENKRGYDLRRLSYIGKLTSDTRVLVRSADATFTDLEGLKTQKGTVPVSVGATPSASLYEAHLMNAMFGLHLRPMSLEDSNARHSAVFLWGFAGTHGDLSSLRGLLEHPSFGVVLQLSSASASDLPDVVLAKDVATGEKAQRMLRAVDAVAGLGRLVVAPPDLPEEKLAELRALFEATVNDSIFQGEGELFGYDLDPATGEEVAKQVNDFLAGPADLQADLLGALQCGRKRAESETEQC